MCFTTALKRGRRATVSALGRSRRTTALPRAGSTLVTPSRVCTGSAAALRRYGPSSATRPVMVTTESASSSIGAITRSSKSRLLASAQAPHPSAHALLSFLKFLKPPMARRDGFAMSLHALRDLPSSRYWSHRLTVGIAEAGGSPEATGVAAIVWTGGMSAKEIAAMKAAASAPRRRERIDESIWDSPFR
jgi:hypothetical protein